MADDKINPMGLLYDEFAEIVHNITIKYSSEAEKYETLETQQAANMYLDVINGKDNFFTYVDYTEHDYINVGITDMDLIETILSTNNTDLVPKQYRQPLLDIRRARVLDTFEEMNEYYRKLNGYPALDDKDYIYPSEKLVIKYGFPSDVPIHKIQDTYNKLVEGQGDYLMAIAEGTGYIDELIELYPDKEYLNYLGSNRITIKRAREALNFQCIQLKNGSLSHSTYESFLEKYEQCREYFVKAIYTKEYKSFIDYYDNFIAMCIMIMTVQQMNISQMMSGINRNFFSSYGVRALYQAYNIPYNLDIDEYTQNELVQNLNLLIQNKATNNVIYNIAYLLGFTNINIYKYYLGKERLFDSFGVPVVKTKEKFNADTGEMETIYDYESMYKLYFQKEELKNSDFTKTFNSRTNTADYKEVTESDPMWSEDDLLYKRIWETEFNFVESKYLGIGVAYSMTNMLFESVLLLKLLMADTALTKTVFVELPKITGSESISIFDIIIYLVCLTASKHNLTGEIITIPTQVISVIDYMRNVEDTSKLVDTLGFDFSYFEPDNTEARDQMNELKRLLGDSEYNKFMKLVNDIAYPKYNDRTSKIKKINSLYTDAKSVYRFLNYHMTATHDKETYDLLRTMSNAIFYSKEMREIFTIEGDLSGQKRTAWTYYEYLYHINPILYSSFFDVDLDTCWRDYLIIHGLTPEEFPYENYLVEVELGNIRVDYGGIKYEYRDQKDETLYYFINHVIDRLSHIVAKLDLVYLMNSSSTALSDLLIELIKFFKSYTVDLINFETLFILDLKPGNNIKLIDEFNNILKTIGKNDILKLSHSDVISRIQAKLQSNESISFMERYLYEKMVEVGESELTKMIDDMESIVASMEVKDNALKTIFDSINVSASITSDDKLAFNDKILLKE